MITAVSHELEAMGELLEQAGAKEVSNVLALQDAECTCMAACQALQRLQACFSLLV